MKVARILITLLTFLAASSATAQVEDARALIQRALDSLPNTTMKAKIELSSSRGWTRSLEIYGKRINDAMASYIEVTAPQDVKDTRFLFFERSFGGASGGGASDGGASFASTSARGSAASALGCSSSLIRTESKRTGPPRRSRHGARATGHQIAELLEPGQANGRTLRAAPKTSVSG